MNDIISFDKSFQQRLAEFESVLSDYTILSASQLKKQWGLFIELTLDKIGWQAIWKLPRITCESLNIPFPSLALVIVLTINSKELKSYVRILAVQNEVAIPDKLWVPLIQIWPTKNQDDTIVLSLMETANSLDILRFFYLHLYMPWDRDEDDNQDWREKHLESRLRFYYDLKNGNIPRGVAEHIHNLLTEARRLHHKREYLEEQIKIDEQNGLEDDQKTTILMEIHVRLLEIRTDIEISENPLLRNIIIKRFSQLDKISRNIESQIWLIFDQGNAEQHINFLNQIKLLYPNDELKFCINLASKLESGNPNDIYLINESYHKILTTGGLENGGIIRGIGNREKIILTTDLDDLMLNFRGDKIILENLTIDVNYAQCGILIRKGNCVIKNCKIIGKSTSSIYQGIIALKNTYLDIENCEITGFSTTIIGNSGSNITIKNSNIYGADIGIKIFDESKINLENVFIKDCMEFGILMDTENNNTNIIGDFQCLEKCPDIICKNVTGVNNTRGNAAILQITELKPIKNLFSDPDKDPTLIGSDDETLEN